LIEEDGLVAEGDRRSPVPISLAVVSGDVLWLARAGNYIIDVGNLTLDWNV